MIDIHTHILPNIDDGAPSVSEAVMMTETLRLSQIETAVCTPHFYPFSISLNDFCNHRDAAMASMGNSRVKLIAGSETMLHDYLFYYPDISPLSIGSTGYLLLELPDTRKWGKPIFDQIKRLMVTYNLYPIIAHVERYEAVIKKEKNIIKLKESGCLLQINANSIIDNKSNHRVLGYLKHGYIDVIASDCHNMNKRPPNLSQAYHIIQQKLGAGYCDRLKENAEYIVKGISFDKNQY